MAVPLRINDRRGCPLSVVPRTVDVSIAIRESFTREQDPTGDWTLQYFRLVAECFEGTVRVGAEGVGVVPPVGGAVIDRIGDVGAQGRSDVRVKCGRQFVDR